MLQGFAAIPAIIAAAILRTDRRIVASLRTAHAFTPATAVGMRLRNGLARWRLARLANAGAIGKSASGDFFLDTVGWAAYRQRRRRRVVLAMATILPLAIALSWAVRDP